VTDIQRFGILSTHTLFNVFRFNGCVYTIIIQDMLPEVINTWNVILLYLLTSTTIKYLELM